MKNELTMTRGSLLRIEDGRELLIYVWEGSLWLTQDGDSRDRYLGAGDWFRLDRDGVAIAQATRRSTVTLTAPQHELYARRIALAKAGTGASIELYSAAKPRRFWTGWFAPQASTTREESHATESAAS